MNERNDGCVVKGSVKDEMVVEQVSDEVQTAMGICSFQKEKSARGGI